MSVTTSTDFAQPLLFTVFFKKTLNKMILEHKKKYFAISFHFGLTRDGLEPDLLGFEPDRFFRNIYWMVFLPPISIFTDFV